MRALPCVAALMRALVGVAVLAVAGCTEPSYGDGHLQCAPSTRACPAGFYCAADDHCWRNGSGPSSPDLGVAGGAADLAGVVVDLLGVGGRDLAITPSSCPSLNTLLCESFEAPLGAGWTATGNSGMASRDTTRAFRGTTSLKAHISAGNAAMSNPSAVIGSSTGLPLLAGRLYARVWAWFPSGLPGPFNQSLNFTDSGTTGLALATDTGNVTLDDYAGSLYTRSTTAMPLDRWTCIQLDFAQGVGVGSIHISVDGQPLPDVSPSGATTPTVVKLFLGLDFYGNSAPVPAYDAWFDELILDNKPTTCDE